jgi:tRNA(Ile)-lysidine synthase
MPPLPTRVRRFIEHQALVGAGDRVVVALSGGPDSTALFWALREVLPGLGASLAGAAHLHHGLRGAAADEDEAFCRELCRGAGVPLVVEHSDVRALAGAQGRSLEAAAHEARMAFLERARRALDATLVATGHTLDDQAETFILRAVRGAGRAALGGIRPRRGHLIRPLLDTARVDLEAWLAARGLPSREDATNRDVRIPRNRVRHEVLPALVAAWPGAVRALSRAARGSAEDADLLDQLATAAQPQVVSRAAAVTTLDIPALLALPPALRRRLVWGALSAAARRPVPASYVERVLDLAVSRTGRTGPLALQGQRVTRVADRLAIEPRGAVPARTPGPRREAPPGPAAPRWHLPVPGVVELPGGLGGITARRVARSAAAIDAGDPTRAVLDAAVAGSRVFVRTRRPGDRLRPLGAAGSRKLQDVLVDRKVPRARRDMVPLVVDAEDRILWVAGHVVDEAARVGAATTDVLLLELRPAGGSR